MSEPHASEQVTHAQKAGVVLLALFAMLVVVLGVLQFRSTIYGPFVTSPSKDAGPATDIARLLEDDEVRLQRIDTDQDGLSDFEELTFYETSPYIPDTDSDGVSDSAEVEAGTDPNCPEGESCEGFNAADGNGAEGNFENPLFDTYEDPLDNVTDTIGVGATTTPSLDTLNTEDRLSVLSIASNPDALRDLLRTNTELTDEQIDDLSDEFILEIAAEILAE